MQKSLKNAAAAAAVTVLLVISFIFPTVSAGASPRSVSSRPKTYKVGANVMCGIKRTDAGYSGLSCDYINAISKYTGDKYVYVNGTEEELFRKLKDGEIDVIPCVTDRTRRHFEELLGGEDGELFSVTGNAIVSRFAGIYVYDKGEYGDTVMNDTAAIRKMTIGYLVSDEQRFFVNGQCTYGEISGANFLPYATEDMMHEDFVSGKIDAAMKDCLRSWADETIVYQFNARRGFFITRTGDTELASKIEDALVSLFTDHPSFYGTTYEKFVGNYGSQKFAYDIEESLYIKSHSAITVAFSLDSDVTKSYDSQNAVLGGVAGAFMEKYAQATGLKVNIKPYNTLSECLGAVSSGEADMAYGGIHTSDMVGRTDFYVTDPAVKYPLVLAGKKNANVSDIMRIAVNTGDKEAAGMLERFYPNAAVIYAENVDSACGMATNGACDVVCLSGFDVAYLTKNGYPSLEVVQGLPIYSTECFAILPSNTGLSGITESALLRINGSQQVTDVYNMMIANQHANPVREGKTWLIVVAFTVLAVVAAGIIIMIVLENKRRAGIDPLTGGFTKQTFINRSAKAIKKSGSVKWDLVIFDIDKFKFVNDRLGYEEGDRMLERMYKTLGDHLNQGEMYARVSDDNFACCIHDAPDTDIIARLNGIFSEFIRRNSLFVSYPVVFSTGVCRLEQCVDKFGAVDMNIGIDRCNIAKKTIKAMHSSEIAFYDGKIREKTLREKDFENIMPAALEKREFMCYIQPKYGAGSRRIEGGEALIRWKSMDFGFVFPDEFIPLAEKTGFVVELDFFILEEVCKAMRRWLDSGLTPVVISVNQSRMHLAHDDYIWRLREIVDKYAIPYEYIELEITETVFTENADLLLHIMQKLHDIGFKLSIDDFGSGYSSLNMLKDIPSDVVKIDREFFNGTVNSDKGRAVITTVVDLAKKLKMQVISEGVETLDQVEFLDEIKCDLIQGYYFAKPMPMNDFEEMWLKEIELHKNAAGEYTV